MTYTWIHKLGCVMQDEAILTVAIATLGYPEEVSGGEIGIQFYHILLVVLDDEVLGREGREGIRT